MMTRRRQRELNLRLAEEKRTLLEDVVALHKQFERRRLPLKKREVKEKRKRTRVNQKVKAF